VALRLRSVSLVLLSKERDDGKVEERWKRILEAG